jgi:hypothetical protein
MGKPGILYTGKRWEVLSNPIERAIFPGAAALGQPAGA